MAAAAQPQAPAPRRERNTRSLWFKFWHSPSAIIGMTVVLALVMAGVLAPWLAPHDPLAQDLLGRLKPPGTPGHWLGTDRVGRDVLSRLLFGLRVSLAVAGGGIVIGAGLGIPLGLLAGYRRGWADALIARAIDVQLALPTVLVAMGVLAVWGRGLGKLILIVGVVGWAFYARTARGSVLSLRERDYVEAARALGAPDRKIVTSHILPAALPPLVILMAVEIPRLVILEATLSFLGLGVPVSVPSLGLIMADGYEVLFSGRWWLTVLPGVLLLLLVLGVNLVGDWLRDALDPRLTRR